MKLRAPKADVILGPIFFVCIMLAIISVSHLARECYLTYKIHRSVFTQQSR